MAFGCCCCWPMPSWTPWLPSNKSKKTHHAPKHQNGLFSRLNVMTRWCEKIPIAISFRFLLLLSCSSWPRRNSLGKRSISLCEIQFQFNTLFFLSVANPRRVSEVFHLSQLFFSIFSLIWASLFGAEWMNAHEFVILFNLRFHFIFLRRNYRVICCAIRVNICGSHLCERSILMSQQKKLAQICLVLARLHRSIIRLYSMRSLST